jgi:hypothetical protein
MSPRFRSRQRGRIDIVTPGYVDREGRFIAFSQARYRRTAEEYICAVGWRTGSCQEKGAQRKPLEKHKTPKGALNVAVRDVPEADVKKPSPARASNVSKGQSPFFRGGRISMG